MITLQDISSAFSSEAEKYPLKRAYLFGSRARGDAREDSDIDIFIDVDEGFSLFDLCGITDALMTKFGRACDVITRSGHKDSVRKEAERDGVLIYELA